jgi:hypothetical protein
MKYIIVNGDFCYYRFYGYHTLVIVKYKDIYATIGSLDRTPYINLSIRKIHNKNHKEFDNNAYSWTVYPVTSITIVVSGLLL